MEEGTEPEHLRPAPETTPPTFTVSLTVLPEQTASHISVDLNFQPDTVTMAIEVTRGVFKPENTGHANAYLRDGGAQQIRSAMRQFQVFISRLEI